MTGLSSKASVGSSNSNRNSKQQQQHKEILELLSCPICFQIMCPPIYQCQNGHTLCSVCKPQVRNKMCPTCHADKLDIRALALEKLSLSVELPTAPCRYSTQGCAEVLRTNIQRQHEEDCPFRPYECPNGAGWCDFAGTVADLVPHLQGLHGCVTSDTADVNVPYVYNHDTPVMWNSHVFSCLGEHFLLNVEGFQSPGDLVYTAFMTFMGPPSQASKFRYRVAVGNDTQWLSWEGLPRSIQDRREELKQKIEGLIIHHSLWSRYDESTDPDTFMVLAKVSVWRVEDAQEDI